MNTEVKDGLWALLVSLILTAVIIYPSLWIYVAAQNLARTLLIFGFFFGISLLTEHALRNLETTSKKHPTVGLLLVLFCTTVMVFSFVGLVLFTR